MKVLFLKKIDIYYAKWATVVQRFLVSLTKLGTYDGIRWFDGTYTVRYILVYLKDIATWVVDNCHLIYICPYLYKGWLWEGVLWSEDHRLPLSCHQTHCQSTGKLFYFIRVQYLKVWANENGSGCGRWLTRGIYFILWWSMFFYIFVPHQWCALFYRLLHSSTRHIEKVEGGERDTQLVHVNEATAV